MGISSMIFGPKGEEEQTIDNQNSSIGREHVAICVSAFVITTATFLEMSANFPIFLLLVCPLLTISNSLLRLSLQSLVTEVASKDALGSVLAALDVLQNACSVSVPFYRTMLFRF